MNKSLKNKFFEQTLNRLSPSEKEMILLLKDCIFHVKDKVFNDTCSLPGFVYSVEIKNHFFNIEKFPDKNCIISIMDNNKNRIMETIVSPEFLQCIRYIKNINEEKKEIEKIKSRENELKNIISFFK